MRGFRSDPKEDHNEELKSQYLVDQNYRRNINLKNQNFWRKGNSDQKENNSNTKGKIEKFKIKNPWKVVSNQNIGNNEGIFIDNTNVSKGELIKIDLDNKISGNKNRKLKHQNQNEKKNEEIFDGEYGNPVFWDERYICEVKHREWYLSYDELKEDIKKIMIDEKLFFSAENNNLEVGRNNVSNSFLISGCGNSQLSESLYKDGFKNVLSIDNSETVINNMKIFYKYIVPDLQFVKMDATKMKSFNSEMFDIVIDKGTLDSLLCNKGGRNSAKLMLKEYFRTLKQEGVVLIVSNGTPYQRFSLLNSTYPRPFIAYKIFNRKPKVYLYILKKSQFNGNSFELLRKPVPELKMKSLVEERMKEINKLKDWSNIKNDKKKKKK